MALKYLSLKERRLETQEDGGPRLQNQVRGCPWVPEESPEFQLEASEALNLAMCFLPYSVVFSVKLSSELPHYMDTWCDLLLASVVSLKRQGYNTVQRNYESHTSNIGAHHPGGQPPPASLELAQKSARGGVGNSRAEPVPHAELQ